MELIPVKVECHSGYKADEYPKNFSWEDKQFEITEIVDRWYQGDRDPNVSPADYFKVKILGGGQYILKHDIDKDKWLLVI